MDDHGDLQPATPACPPLLQHTSSSPPCYLLALPLELRYHIYDLAVPNLYYTAAHLRRRHSRAVLPLPALGTVNHRLREELYTYLFKARPVRVELCDDLENDLDTLWQCLVGLGPRVAWIRRLEIRHHVDFYFPNQRSNTGSVGVVTSVFVAKGDCGDHNQRVTMECDFNTEGNVGDEIPAQYAICRCSLADRLARAESSQASKGTCPFACSPSYALLDAVRPFLRLVGVETHGVYSGRTISRCSTEMWPTCSVCGGRCWFIRGPPSPQPGRVYFKGHWWIVCPPGPGEGMGPRKPTVTRK